MGKKQKHAALHAEKSSVKSVAAAKDSDFDIVGLLKSHYPWVLISLFVMAGFYLRIYHVNYPVIGYHDWKETHHLTEARNFARDGFFKYGFFIPAWDYPSLSEDPSGKHPDTFPFYQIFSTVIFWIFGYQAVFLRLLSIMLILCLVPLMYLIVKLLYNREDYALIVAFLVAINPLFTFFGRQADLINLALPFTMAGLYFYLRWRVEFKPLFFNLFVILWSIGFLTKYDHFILVFPVAATFPYRKFFTTLKENITKYVPAMIAGLMIPAWLGYTHLYSPEVSGFLSSHPGTVFSQEWLLPVKSYIADNYTNYGFALALVGIVLVAMLFRKSFGNKFLAAFVAGGVVWTFITAPYLEGHAYHQYPIAPLIIMLIGFAVITLANTVKGVVSGERMGNVAKWLVVLILIGFLIPPTMQARARMFDTQFFGIDIAGAYINAHSQPGERVFHSGHQSYGVLWHADRKGTSFPSNVTRLEQAEEDLNFRWFLMYQWGFQKYLQDPAYAEAWQHVKDNYSLKQVAFMKTPQGDVPIYFLFQRGGSFNESMLGSLVQNKPVQMKTYEQTFQKVDIYFIDI